MSDQHQPQQNKVVYYMSQALRPLNFVGGAGTIATAFFVLIFVGIDFRSLLNLYFTALLGVLLLAGEFNLTVINENCKFLVTLLGRGCYDIFVGGWVYSLSNYFVARSDSLIDELSYLTAYCVYLVIFYSIVLFSCSTALHAIMAFNYYPDLVNNMVFD